MQKGTILSVDDDAGLQFVIQEYLENDGYKMVTAGTAQEAITQASTNALNVILLDLNLPDAEGVTLIPQFRAQSDAGIIIVSGKDDTTEKIICLEMGADDYITKPFEMRELSARVKAVIRRRAATPASTINDNTAADKTDTVTFNGGWTLDRAKYQVFTPDNIAADLTTGEFQLLDALIRANNRALTREHLFELTRDGNLEAYDRAIDIQISRVRKKIDDHDQSLIKTVRGVGYMFCGAIV